MEAKLTPLVSTNKVLKLTGVLIVVVVVICHALRTDLALYLSLDQFLYVLNCTHTFFARRLVHVLFRPPRDLFVEHFLTFSNGSVDWLRMYCQLREIIARGSQLDTCIDAVSTSFALDT